ncbi:Spy/CpxP family protein refolding chaperone [Pelobacter seleniigenes]|uniref:Spy/CpxP family protein refolding chaperone n=1 Tax=Pelobacter seleniigenes TaxID=407188 RepID=UPI0004A6F1C4|nr:Spy/CpxP family protein refolding chaperone [Pelobacter seleniigenes]
MKNSLLLSTLIFLLIAANVSAFQGPPPAMFSGCGCQINGMTTDQPAPPLPQDDSFIKLNLSTEQQQQILQIKAAAEESSRQLIANLDQQHKKLQAMEQTRSFNEEDFRVAAAAAAKTETELLVLKAKTRFQLQAVLTSEQQATLVLLLNSRPQQPLPMPGQPGCRNVNWPAGPRPMPVF